MEVHNNQSPQHFHIITDNSTIVPFISNDEILVIKSYRDLVNSIQIEAPSGYIEDGEDPAEAALRELREETGCRTNRIFSIGSYTLDYTMFEQKGCIRSGERRGSEDRDHGIDRNNDPDYKGDHEVSIRWKNTECIIDRGILPNNIFSS